MTEKTRTWPPGVEPEVDQLTASEVATWLRVHPNTVLLYLKDGRMRGALVGKSYRIGKAAVLEFLANSGAGRAPQGRKGVAP